MSELRLSSVEGLPEIEPGSDLGALLARAGAGPGDVLLVAQKAVSRAEGRLVPLAGVQAGERATAFAAEHDKDPRFVQVVLDESHEVLRAERGVLICETRHGFVCANAGVDVSNAPADDVAILLPEDPDSSARALRARIAELSGRCPAVVITDSFGRAWRLGQVDVAIGAAGIAPLDDWRGREDHGGRELTATVIAVADALAAAADLARAKDSREPVVIARGLDRFVTDDDGPGAAALRRPPEEDLFR